MIESYGEGMTLVDFLSFPQEQWRILMIALHYATIRQFMRGDIEESIRLSDCLGIARAQWRASNPLTRN